MKRIVMLLIACALLQACAWVELTPEAQKVRVLAASEVTGCKKLGTTRVSVKADVAGLDRYPEDVQRDLEAVARNSAVDMQGDTVVAVSAPEDGRQLYEVYRCINP